MLLCCVLYWSRHLCFPFFCAVICRSICLVHSMGKRMSSSIFLWHSPKWIPYSNIVKLYMCSGKHGWWGNWLHQFLWFSAMNKTTTFFSLHRQHSEHFVQCGSIGRLFFLIILFPFLQYPLQSPSLNESNHVVLLYITIRITQLICLVLGHFEKIWIRNIEKCAFSTMDEMNKQQTTQSLQIVIEQITFQANHRFAVWAVGMCSANVTVEHIKLSIASNPK